jgi:hypothetical protein
MESIPGPLNRLQIRGVVQIWWVSCACCWVRWCCRRWSGCWWRRPATSSPYTPAPTPGQTSPPSPTQVRCLLQRILTTKYLYIYTEYHSECPLVGIGTPPTPLPQASVPPPEPKGGVGGHTRLRVGGGESQFRRLEKKLSTLPTM